MGFPRAELPFDEVPSGAASSDATSAVRAVTLTRLYAEIGRAVAAPGRVQVDGDVHDRRVTQQGAIWFTLRDRAVDLPVLISAGRARRSRIVDGERVSVVGRVTLQQRKLQLRMEAEEVTPVGEGAVAALIAQVRARLESEGFLDRPRRPIPMLPSGIGVVCGTDAAVRRDIESVVAARFPGFPVRFVETSVQGAGAADAVRRAIEDLVADPGVDVIVLARGGGSAVDLLPFSDEDLCRAVATCSKAVVSAIGHDGDRPVCDDVADLRCGTPSIAAQMVIPEVVVLRDSLDRARRDVERSSARHLAAGQRALESIRWDSALDRRCASLRRALGDVRWTNALDLRVDRERASLSAIAWSGVAPARCSSARRQLDSIDPEAPLRRRVDGGRSQLALLDARTHALSPARVLERGYAVVRSVDGSVLRRAQDTSSGERLDITLAAGHIQVEVHHVG